MAPKSLLRYIFRHGPRGKSRNAAPELRRKAEVLMPSPWSSDLVSYQQHPRTQDGPELPLPLKTRPENHPVDRSDSRASSVLDDIPEESSSEAEYPEYDDSLITETLSTLSFDMQSYTTRDLILATLNEAKTATDGHLDTINTTVALLDVLDGFSATIEVLKDEMVAKKEVYEEKMSLLDDLERAVERMHFDGEILEKETWEEVQGRHNVAA
jgi:hypothetical protein